MIAMRITSLVTGLVTSLAVLAGLALTACDQDPTFDASSAAAYQRSFGEITAKLSAEDRRRLDVALLTLALGNNAMSNALELTSPESMNDLVTLDGVADPLLYLDRVRPGISGRSAAAVIRNVAAELDNEISRAEARAAGADKLVAAVVIDHPRYYWDSRHKVPTIEFSVYNGGKTAISRIYISGVLAVPGRAGKWVTGGLNYRFERELQPGVQIPVTVPMRITSPQTAMQLQNLHDANMTVKVTNIEDTSGKKLVPLDTDVLEGMRNKRDFLRGS
jgi:hypothetical protein